MGENVVDLGELAQQVAIINNNRMMAGRTLRDLYLYHVYARITLYNEASSPVRIENLPPQLKDDLLRRLMYSAVPHRYRPPPTVLRKSLNCMISLLHPSTTFFFMPEHFTSMVEPFEKILEAISRKCQRIRGIRINHTRSLSYHQERLKIAIFRGLSEPPLVYLQFLALPLRCADAELQFIAQNVPNLVVLEMYGVGNSTVSKGIKALSTLPHLRRFLFYLHNNNWQMELKCLLLCAKFLPKLHVVGFSKYHSDQSNIYDINSAAYHKSLVEQRVPVTLGLRELLLVGEVHLHPTCRLPDLQSLLLCKPEGDFSCVAQRFSTVTELTFFMADAKVVEDVVKEVGQNVTKLVINYTESLPLFEILLLCPNLKFLSVYCCPALKSHGTWPVNFLSNLEHLHICFKKPQLLTPTGFITQVLCAPWLKKVKMYQVLLTDSDMEELLRLVREKQIFKHLESFKWLCEFDKDAEKALFQLLINTVEVSFPLVEY